MAIKTDHGNALNAKISITLTITDMPSVVG